MILHLHNMIAIDATGLHALESLPERLQQAGKTLLVCGIRNQPAQMLKRSSITSSIGQENILPHIEAALQRAQEIMESFDGMGEDIAKDYDTTHAPL